MKLYNITTKEVNPEQVEQDRLFNVFVFGLPRSGTSMMTHIVELLGVNMIYTSENDKEKTDKRFRDKYGEYHANPNGFFEITENGFENYLDILNTPYSGCKIIVPVNGWRWEFVKLIPCKVILMMRDPEEIRQSQMAYYRKDDIDIAAIRSLLASEKIKLRKNNIPNLIVEYRNVLEHPVEVVSDISEFINSPNDLDEAIKSIKPKDNRFKKEELISGI